MLRDDGFRVQVYHAADRLSMGMRICRTQSSSKDQMQEAGDEGRHRCCNESIGFAESVGFTESVQGITGAVKEPVSL